MSFIETAAAQEVAGRMQPADPAAVSAELVRQYPPALLRAGMSGSVRLLAFVSAAGEPDSVHVIWSSGIAALDRAAVRVMRSMKYAPIDAAADAVAGWEALTLHFSPQPLALSAPRLLNRDEVSTQFHAAGPAELRARGIEDETGLLLHIEPSGAVRGTAVLTPSCFPAAEHAARMVAQALRFEPISGDSVRESTVTISFAVDSVHIRARGDSMTLARRTDPEDGTSPPGRSRAPRLTNGAVVQRVLADIYPRELRQAGIGGTSVVWFHINERGRVTRSRLSQTSGRCELDIAALHMAPILEFTPAVVNGRRQEAWVELPIVFSAR